MSTKHTSKQATHPIHAITKTTPNLLSSPPKPNPLPPPPSLSSMLRIVALHLRRLCSCLRCFRSRRSRRRPKIKIKIKTKTKDLPKQSNGHVHVPHTSPQSQSIRLATFNAAMFSMAPAVPTTTVHDRPPNPPLPLPPPRGILKQQKLSSSKRRVSINLPEDEITANSKGKAAAADHHGRLRWRSDQSTCRSSDRSVMEVLREAGADVIAVQNVKAEEEKGMRPLSELAEGLGMEYVFAESWAPEYGNAILSRWPIKRWRVQKIFDDTDFRNVLKATIEVPKAGEIHFHCTHLDHLDENWRMKQISAILRSGDGPHLLAGGLNSLDETDYSSERWNDIVKYYEEIGKPTPKVEVMKFLKGKQYSDAKEFAGECESVVVVAKGQDVQGTCKYGTRVDYILASPNSPYKFVPGSYGVVSSKGTSDHHIVKVDVVIDNSMENNRPEPKKRFVKIDKASFKGIWRTNSSY